MEIALDTLRVAAPKTSVATLQGYLGTLNRVCAKYNIITSAERLAAFLAQTSHESAGWFWNKKNLNSYCDASDSVGLTKAINGGLNRLEERKQKYAAIVKAIK